MNGYYIQMNYDQEIYVSQTENKKIVFKIQGFGYLVVNDSLI